MSEEEVRDLRVNIFAYYQFYMSAADKGFCRRLFQAEELDFPSELEVEAQWTVNDAYWMQAFEDEEAGIVPAQYSEDLQDYVETLASIDVDGDGDIDVLSAPNAEQKIYWYENNGSQSFNINTIATSRSTYFVKAVDLDRDGDMDVVSVDGSSLGNGVKWHENNGSQNFTTHSIYQGSADETYGYGIADLDKDGDIWLSISILVIIVLPIVSYFLVKEVKLETREKSNSIENPKEIRQWKRIEVLKDYRFYIISMTMLAMPWIATGSFVYQSFIITSTVSYTHLTLPTNREV